MITIITLSTSRDAYDIRDAARDSITVGELIDELKRCDEDAKVVFSNDNGYTYGALDTRYTVDSECVKTQEEEEYEEKMDELHEELTELQAEYENPELRCDGEEPITDEQYREMRANLFKEYGISEEEYNKWDF